MSPSDGDHRHGGRGADEAWQAALVSEARQGDEAAFEALVRLHQDRAYHVAMRMTGTTHDAQDVVQDALLQAWRSLPRFRGDAGFGTWLTRIVINRCHNHRRGSRPTEPLTEDLAVQTTPGADAVVLAAQRRDATVDAVLELPFDQRSALVLHTFAGCTHAETACILDITENAAKVRVHRARRTLTTRLQDWR